MATIHILDWNTDDVELTSFTMEAVSPKAALIDNFTEDEKDTIKPGSPYAKEHQEWYDTVLNELKQLPNAEVVILDDDLYSDFHVLFASADYDKAALALVAWLIETSK